MKSKTENLDIINNIFLEEFQKDLQAVNIKQRENHISYALFKPINKNNVAKIYPLTIPDNKKIADIMEDFPKPEDLENLKNLPPEEAEAKIKFYKSKVMEIQTNVNAILSDKVQIDNGSFANMEMINLLDYQFIILNIFSVMNKNIKYKVNIETSDLEVSIPIDREILATVADTITMKKESQTKKDNIDYRLQFDYQIRKLVYNPEDSLIKGLPVNKSDFKDWLNTMEYKLSDKISVIFRPVNICDYLKIYLSIIELQAKIKSEMMKKIGSFLIDMNFGLIKDLIIGIWYDGKMLNVKDYPQVLDNVMNTLYNINEDQLSEIVNIIYSSVFRLEIDVSVYKKYAVPVEIDMGTTALTEKEELVKKETWFDSGLSFFFNL